MTELIKELEGFFGIENISFDAQGLCSFRLQDRDVLMLRHDVEKKRLVIAAEIGKATPLSQDLLIAALSFNFNRLAISGAWLSLDNETKTLFLADEFFLEVIERETFHERLTLFFQHYLTCQGIFSEAAAEALLQRESQVDVVKVEGFA
jgi:hypothetical protein